MNDQVEVSIITNAYNHENYIAQTLDGFINQKTSFKYEVLVHDDASTDRTAEIIKDYAKKYPEIIKPICQIENQYSKDVDITRVIQVPRAKGRYIAMCEGDDYWCDDYKLQKQFDAMEKNQCVNICAAGARILIEEKNSGTICPSRDETIFTLPQVIDGGGGFVATASLMIRKSLFEQEEPEFRKIFSFDYTLQVWGAMNGGMLYLPEVMTVYRLYTPSSWSNSIRKNEKARLAHNLLVIECLQQMDVDTKHIAKKIIDEKIQKLEFDNLFYKRQFRKMLSREYKCQYKKCSIKKKIYILIRSYIPLKFGKEEM